MIPVGVREVDDSWFELLGAAPPEMRSVPSGDYKSYMSDLLQVKDIL